MKRWICLFALLLASCGNDGGKVVDQHPKKPTLNELGLPMRQPNGSALNAAFCDTEEASQIYGNQKGCVIVACEGGDKQSCGIAQIYATSLGPDDGITERPREPAKLEGMDYSKARRTIVGYGWTPTPGECVQGTSEQACKSFPEIGNCSGTGLGFCDMNFTRRDRCLSVVTTGGPPDGALDGEPSIRDVRFYRGPCHKDPNEGRL